MKASSMTAVIGGKRYNTETATEIASDCYWDGHNFERRGRNTFLFKTKNGNYFVQHLTQWQGERDRLEPVTQDEAVSLWETSLTEHSVEFEIAFPGVAVSEA